MDNLSNKEEKFRDILADQTYKVDTDALWDDISKRLPPEKNNRRLPLFPIFGISFGLLVFGSIFYIIMNSKSVVNQNSNEYLQSNILERTDKNNSSLSKLASITGKQNSDSSINVISSVQKTNKQISQKQKSEVEITNNTIPKKQNKDGEFEVNKTKLKTNILPSNKSNTTVKAIESLPAIMDFNSQNNITPSSANLNMANVTPKTNNFTTYGSNDQNGINTGNSNSDQNNVMVQYDAMVGVNTLGGLPQKINYNFPVKSSSEQFTNPIKKDIWIPYFSIRIGVNSSMSSTSNTLPDIIDDFPPNADPSPEAIRYNALVDYGVSNETDLYGVDFDANFGLENSRGWRLFAGIGFSQQVAAYKNEEKLTTVGTTDGIETIYINDQGEESLSFSSSVNQQVVKNYDIVWHRKHNLYNLNVGIGKEIYSKNRFTFSTEIGVSYAAFTQHTGYYFDEFGTFAKFENNESNPYKSSGIWNASLGLNFEYNVGPVSIVIIPNFRYNLNGFTSNDNFYRLDNSRFGIQIGTTHRLF